jgi:hypothetical protein
MFHEVGSRISLVHGTFTWSSCSLALDNYVPRPTRTLEGPGVLSLRDIPALGIKEASSEAISSKGSEAAAADPKRDTEPGKSHSEHSVRFNEDVQAQFCYGLCQPLSSACRRSRL